MDPTKLSCPVKSHLAGTTEVEATRASRDRVGSFRERLVWTLCLLLAAALAIAGSVVLRKSAAPTPGVARPAQPLVPAPPTRPARRAEPPGFPGVVLESRGYLVPEHQILISPKVVGMILHLHFSEGMRVNKGDVLAELEDTDYQANCRRAEATLDAARQRLMQLQRGNRPEEISEAAADLAEAEAQLVELKSERDRTRRLLSENAISRQEYEQSESHYCSMVRHVERLQWALKVSRDGPRVEEIENAKDVVREAEADLAKAKWSLDNCTIRAPISGVILKKNVEENTVVNPFAFFNGGYGVCTLADLSDLEVDLSIQECNVARVFPGQKCQGRAEAYPDRTYDGYVSRLMPTANRATGAIPVRVKLLPPAEEEGVYLKPDMGVTVSFLSAAFSKPVANARAPGQTLPGPPLK